MLETETELLCYHCGLECQNDNIHVEDKYFCCNGCQTVFQILSENNLCQYYDIDKMAGLKPQNELFNFLENNEICNELLDFQNDIIAKVTFYIPSIHCSSCLYLLENLPKINQSIERATVNFLKKTVSITYNLKLISLKQLAELLTSLGYEPLISKQANLSKLKAKTNRKLITKLAVAGFCAGNIMMFSFPEYLGLQDVAFKHLFGYLNIILAIPVVFYSASGYFVSVFKSASFSKINNSQPIDSQYLIKNKFINKILPLGLNLNIDFPILLSILVAFFAGIYQVVFQNGAGYFDSLAGLIFFLLIGKWFQQKSYDFLSFERDYKSYFPLAVTKIAFGNEIQIALNQLQIGDKILVRNGEIIPADGLLYKGIGHIDYSFVTGETAIETKKLGDLLYAGGKQTGGAIEMEVLKNVSQSYLTQLWNNDTFQKPQSSKIVSFSNIVGKYFTFAVLLLAIFVAIFWQIYDPTKALYAFVSVLIIACPCTLALSYPFALGNGLRLLGKQNFFLKNSEIIEKMANCNAIVFDKTGTITLGNATKVQFVGQRKLSVFVENLVVALVKNSTHPLALQIGQILPQNNCFSISDFKEVSGKGISGKYEGFEIKLGAKRFINLPFNIEINLNNPKTAISFLTINGEYLGYFNLPNEYRPGIEATIKRLTKGYETFLLSGDNDAERKQLEKSFVIKRNLYFNLSPHDKLNFIKNLQNEGKKVIMLGDGLNDAGALKQADVGIAVTENTLNFTPMSDGILLAIQLSNLPKYLKYSRFGMKLIKYSYGFSLMYNIIGLSFAVQGTLSPIVSAVLMPLNSITLVGIASLGMIWGNKKILA
jgi:P-type Cu+ transporter